jgi:hypothetical protein
VGQYEIEPVQGCGIVGVYLPPSCSYFALPPKHLPSGAARSPAHGCLPERRRLAGRYNVKTPLRVRIWKSRTPGVAAESVNLSQRGICFATASPLSEGEAVEIFFHMPEEVIGEPTSEWRCTGHVVRIEAIKAKAGNLGVGVQFDCYEVSRSTPVGVAIGTGVPVRMLSDAAPTETESYYGKASDHC